MIEEHKEDLIDRLAENLLTESNGDFNLSKKAANEGIDEVKKLLLNHSQSI